jgi:hypothetical protein
MKIAFVAHPVPGSPETIRSWATHIWVHQVARRLARTNSVVVYTGRTLGARGKPSGLTVLNIGVIGYQAIPRTVCGFIVR